MLGIGGLSESPLVNRRQVVFSNQTSKAAAFLDFTAGNELDAKATRIENRES
jgi:hypothetical protein